MNSIPPLNEKKKKEITQFSKQRAALKWMNFRVQEEHDKRVVTLHMSVFNPEHPLHPPGHAVHMSGIGTTASCQCLIPSWICLNQTHTWMDICPHRLWCTRYTLMILLWPFPGRAFVSSDQLAHELSLSVFAMILQDTVNISCDGVTLIV